MTDAVVIDASACLALLLREPWAAIVRAAIERWAAEGTRVLVPEHFWLEIVNTLGRRRRLTDLEVLQGLHDLDAMGLETVPSDRPQLLLVLDLMVRNGLTAYDAAYLALARSSGARLATLDQALRRAGWDILDEGLGEVPPGRDRRLSEEGAPYGDEAAVTWQRWSGAASYLGTLRRRAIEATSDTAQTIPSARRRATSPGP